jgi:hypothetical protein
MQRDLGQTSAPTGMPWHGLDWLGLSQAEPSEAREILTRAKPERFWLESSQAKSSLFGANNFVFPANKFAWK